MRNYCRGFELKDGSCSYRLKPGGPVSEPPQDDPKLHADRGLETPRGISSPDACREGETLAACARLRCGVCVKLDPIERGVQLPDGRA